MVEPVGGYNYGPYFSGSGTAAKSAASDTSSVSSSLGQTAPPANSTGIMGFLTGNEDTREAHEKEENKNGPLGGLLGGIWNGLKNTIQTLCTPEGLLMVGGIIALNIMTGGAITPILFVLGATVGTYQVGKGLAKDDWEGVGQGVFTLGTTFLGAKFDFFNVKNKQTGEKFAMSVGEAKKTDVATASKTMPTVSDNFRLVGGQKMTGNKGGQQNIYQVGWDNMKYRWATMRGNPPPGAPPGNPTNGVSAASSGTAVNPFAQSSIGKPTPTS